MDKEFGGARPKLKTFRRDQEKPETDRNSIASQESAENDATTSEIQNTSTLYTEKEAPGDMFFKEDHFTEEEFNVEQEVCSHRDLNKRGTGSHGDRQFVGEYLPLTNRLINNAIRGTCLNAPSQSKKQQSASCNDKYMNQFKGLDACEPKKTESSARDRWKKSGVALRNYLLSKFGYRADKEEKVTPCLTCFPNINSAKTIAFKQSEHYSDDKRNRHLSQTCQKCLESDHPSKPANRKSDKQGKTSNHAGKSSKLQKGKRSNCQRKEVHEKENSDTNPSSGPSPCNSVLETDSGSVNSDWTMNSKLTIGKQRVCECRPAMNISSDRKCSCDWSLESHDQKKKSSHKDESFLHEMQKAPSVKLNGKLAKKKSWVGLLDHVLTSSTDTDCDEFISSASYAKRRRRKSNSRNSTKSYHGDNETEADSHLHSSISTENPERTVQNDHHSEEVGQKSLPTQQKDILCELKYALPYLPEKLRRRLYSTPVKQDKKQPSSKIEFSTPSESNIRSNSRFLVDDFDRETIALKERYANTYGKVCDMDIKEKYQCLIDSDNYTENKTVGNSDSGDEDVLPTAMKTRDSEVKFHLNDSGTWTMTNFDDSEGDHEDINQDHQQRCWSPLTGQLADVARYGHGHWLDHEIVHLEASLEDPFNVRGDNLILNSSPPNMIKFGEDLGSDLEDKSEGHSHRFSSSLTGQFADNARYQHADWLGYDIVQPETLLKDPFNIREDKPILYYSPSKKMNSSLNSHQETECEDILTKDHERCSASMHLDEPYVNIETDEHKSCNNRLSSRLGRNIQKTSKTRSNRSYSNLYDSSFGFLENDIHSSAKLNVSDVTIPQTEIAQHKPESPCSSNKKQDDDSGRKVDNSVDYSNSFGIEGDYSTWTMEESEIKGDNSVDDLCSGLSKIPLSADNLGRNAVSHSSTLDDLNMSRSWKTFSQESDLDADDEFECDCEYCISLRQLSMNQSDGLVIDVARQQSSPVIPDEFDAPIDNLSVPGPDLDIGISELMSLDFVVSETNRDMGLGVMLENVILQLLMDNVIMQMVNVRPDLMSDPTPPPATESVIDNIPTICLSQQDIDQNPVCPICLCPSTLGETMSRLPCQHIFHPLCVQAWLVKSGTCPVCRHRL